MPGPPATPPPWVQPGSLHITISVFFLIQWETACSYSLVENILSEHLLRDGAESLRPRFRAVCSLLSTCSTFAKVPEPSRVLTCEPGSVSFLPPEDPGTITCSSMGRAPATRPGPFFIPRIGAACIPAGAGSVLGSGGSWPRGSHSRGAPARGAGVLFLSSGQTQR